jgi:creatinine amidohydrolase
MIRMNEMTWMEFKAKIDEGAITILPIGACEQHGPHLPLCVDTVLANGFAERLAQRVGGMVAPAINYGYKSKPLSGGGPLFPGTVDLNGDTLVRLTYDVLEELIKDGVKKIMVLFIFRLAILIATRVFVTKLLRHNIKFVKETL